MSEQANYERDIWDEFWSSGSNSGGLVRDCPHGITWFNDDEQAGDWEEGELERLRERSVSDPNCQRGLNGVHDTTQLGKHWVWGCPQCMADAKRHQDFLWSNRRSIMMFLNARLKKVAKEAEEEVKLLTTKEA